MNMKDIVKSMRTLIFLQLCLYTMFFNACGNDELDPKSLLSSYRVVGLRAEPPELTLNTTTTLSLYDFHPKDLSGERPKVEYSWRLCPFSLGSITQYDCFVEELPLEGLNNPMETMEGMVEEQDQSTLSHLPPANASLILNPVELFAAFGEDLQAQMEQVEMGAGMLGSEMNFFESGFFEIYVKLTVRIEEEDEFEAVKALTVSFDPDRSINQNPILDEISASISLDTKPSVEIKEEVTVSITAREGSVESFEEPLSVSDIEEGVKSEAIEETLLVSYYTTSGLFDQAVKLLEDNETTLTIGEETGKHRLYITLRDGRGGLDLRMYDYEVIE